MNTLAFVLVKPLYSEDDEFLAFHTSYLATLLLLISFFKTLIHVLTHDFAFFFQRKSFHLWAILAEYSTTSVWKLFGSCFADPTITKNSDPLYFLQWIEYCSL